MLTPDEIIARAKADRETCRAASATGIPIDQEPSATPSMLSYGQIPKRIPKQISTGDEMRIAEVKVAKTTCETTRLVAIPKGIVGATVSIEYTDSVWDDLQKTVVFRSAVTKDVLAAGNEVVVPAEVVSRAGMNLYMGVYGVNTANNVVIPTIWTDLGMIRSAASPSGDTTTDKSSLVAAINEALINGCGEVDPSAVQKIVEDYLKANPPQAGTDGKDGITPTIGENGNWYLGDTDTGKPSRGAAGEKGDKGDPGVQGAPGEKGDKGDKGNRAKREPQARMGSPPISTPRMAATPEPRRISWRSWHKKS